MKISLSQGYFSDYVVLEAKSGLPIADVMLLLPLQDRESFNLLKTFIDSGEATPDIIQAFARYQRQWEDLDRAIEPPELGDYRDAEGRENIELVLGRKEIAELKAKLEYLTLQIHEAKDFEERRKAELASETKRRCHIQSCKGGKP